MVHTVKFLERGKGFITFHITEINSEFAVFREDETPAEPIVSSYVLRRFLAAQLNIFFI